MSNNYYNTCTHILVNKIRIIRLHLVTLFRVNRFLLHLSQSKPGCIFPNFCFTNITELPYENHLFCFNIVNRPFVIAIIIFGMLLKRYTGFLR